jgi:hypothetical protein
MKSALSTIALFLGLAAATFTTLPAAAPTDGDLSRTSGVQFAHRSQLNMGDAITADIQVATAGLTEVTLTDLRGQAIWKKDIALKEGRNTLRFRLTELKPGMYLLKIGTPEGVQTRSFSIR